MHNIFVIFTGGTGGHVLPSVSFGNHLIDNGLKCILITDARGKKYTNQFKGKVKTINASHLTGGFFFKIIALIKLFFGFYQSLLFLSKLFSFQMLYSEKFDYNKVLYISIRTL